jgi:hypothetical protein
MKNSSLTSIALIWTSLLIGSSADAQQEGTSTTTANVAKSAGKGLNPDIGVNFLGLFRKSVRGNDATVERPNGFSFQEAEFQFSADVDPYLRAVGLFSIKEVESATGHDHEFGLEPEEVFAETLAIPAVTFRAGKFKAALGRHNILHTHAFPFIDAPLINEAILGEEGLNDVGASASFLIPAPWFVELTVQGIAGGSEVLYASSNPNHIVGAGQLKNLWDLSDEATIELNIFGTTGQNRFESQSHVLGSDLTFKWRPSEGGKYQSLTWTTEYLNGFIGGNTVATSPAEFGSRLGGVASWFQYQFAQRWWAQVRFEHLGFPREEGVEPTHKQSALLGFFPSEFSGFRLQYDRLTQTGNSDDHAVALQWNISIGAHPAHAY